MISPVVAVLIAALTALVTWAFTWGRASKDIEALTKAVEKLVEKMDALVLDVEKLKWHTGPHGALRGNTGSHGNDGE